MNRISPPAGESWQMRGYVGQDIVPCFMTGKRAASRPNITGFVESKESGERIVEMLGGMAMLDYSHGDPRYPQVKVGADFEQQKALLLLRGLVIEAGDRITPQMVELVKREYRLG